MFKGKPTKTPFCVSFKKLANMNPLSGTKIVNEGCCRIRKLPGTGCIVKPVVSDYLSHRLISCTRTQQPATINPEITSPPFKEGRLKRQLANVRLHGLQTWRMQACMLHHICLTGMISYTLFQENAPHLPYQHRKLTSNA